jgi:Family of unknown function (DUF6600)
MTRTLPRILTAFLLLASIINFGFAQSPVFQDTESPDVDDSAPVARVARLSFVDGDVSFLRAGVTEWAPAVENLPLLAGDQLYTGSGARAEIQLARGNYIRLPESAELTISALSESGAQFEITEGTAIIRLERLTTTFARFEIDTPNTAVIFQQDGLYRIEVRGEKDSTLIVSRGEAEVSTEEGTFRVREGRRMLVNTTTGGRLELAADAAGDDWDLWGHDRDVTIARTGADLSPDYVINYETTYNDFYGASDLSSYGTWTNYSSYGQCWIPRVGADWAPYRFGQWLWIPAAGWTWLASERWGWAPYHYGRWAFLTGLGWAWIPGFGSAYRGYGYRDYHWRPALVYFFNTNTPRGNYIGWYPLAPGDRWRRHRDDRADTRHPFPRDGRRGSGESDRSQLHHGMTILPADGFTRGNRSGVRPGAPGRELSDLISKGARAGLPEMKALPVSAAPELAESDSRRSRRLAVPAAEIIKRPVITRNAAVDAPTSFVGQRERRIILPRDPDAQAQAPSKKERRSRPLPTDSDDKNSVDTRANQKTRVALPAPTEKTDGDRSVRERKQNREADATVDNSERRGESNNNAEKAERRRARQEQLSNPTSGGVTPSSDGNREKESRARERGNIDPAPNQDSKTKNRGEEPSRSYDRGNPGKAEARQERSNSENQTRQERHQEKEQRQERQQRESPKKP